LDEKYSYALRTPEIYYYPATSIDPID
jgi:hypothetical protein